MRLPAPFSRLGFGVTGPHATPLVAPAATEALIAAAVAAGVTLFDTGPMYGAGEGERRLGAALRSLPREAVFVCTKARTRPISADDGAAAAPDRVRRSLAESLARLGLDRVDALFLHGPTPEDFTSSLMQALAGLKAEGLIGAIGVCGRGAELDAALENDGIDLLMMPVTGPPGRLARAAAKGIPVIAIETMRARNAPLRLPTSAADLWYLARAGRDALTGTAPAGSGIAAALAAPAVVSVVVQTTRLAHLRANAAEARQ